MRNARGQLSYGCHLLGASEGLSQTAYVPVARDELIILLPEFLRRLGDAITRLS